MKLKSPILFFFSVLYCHIFYGQSIHKLDSVNEALFSKTYFLIRSDDFSNASKYADTLYKNGLIKKDGYLQASASNLKGIIFSATLRLDSAEKYMNKSLDLYRTLKATDKEQAVLSNLAIVARKRNGSFENEKKIREGILSLKAQNSYLYFQHQIGYIRLQYEKGAFKAVKTFTTEWLEFYNSFDFSKTPIVFTNDIKNNIKYKCLAYKAYALIHEGNYDVGYKLMAQSESVLAKETDYMSRKELADYYYFKARYFLEYKKNEDSINYYLSHFFNFNNIAYSSFKQGYKKDLLKLQKAQREADLLDLAQEKNIALSKQYNLIVLLSICGFVILSMLIIKTYRNNIFRKETQLLLETQNEELRTIDKERNHFFSIVTHELRTPMYSVKGLIELISEEYTIKKTFNLSYFNSLRTISNHLFLLIDNILQYSKFNLGENKLVFEKVEFRAFLNEFIQPFMVHNKINIDVKDEVYDMLILDRIKLSQILINLIRNAIKFSDNGSIWITIENVYQDKKYNEIKFSIRDEGRGIAPDKLNSIFNAFDKMNSRIEDDEGTGLGLYIVKNIIALFNSKINVVSTVGKGTTFSFNLKLKKFKKAERANENMTLNGLSVLVVDDNQINLMITQKQIIAAKGVCIATDNGYKAIELLKQNTFDVVLMDVHMPEIDGLQTTSIIRTFNKTVSIIALTAVDLESNHDFILNSGVNAIVSKPFDLGYLITKIKNTSSEIEKCLNAS